MYEPWWTGCLRNKTEKINRLSNVFFNDLKLFLRSPHLSVNLFSNYPRWLAHDKIFTLYFMFIYLLARVVMRSLSDCCIILSPSCLSYDKRHNCNGTTARVKLCTNSGEPYPENGTAGKWKSETGRRNFPSSVLYEREKQTAGPRSAKRTKSIIKSPVVRIMSAKRMFCFSTAAAAATTAAVSM